MASTHPPPPMPSFEPVDSMAPTAANVWKLMLVELVLTVAFVLLTNYGLIQLCDVDLFAGVLGFDGFVSLVYRANPTVPWLGGWINLLAGALYLVMAVVIQALLMHPAARTEPLRRRMSLMLLAAVVSTFFMFATGGLWIPNRPWQHHGDPGPRVFVTIAVLWLLAAPMEYWFPPWRRSPAASTRMHLGDLAFCLASAVLLTALVCLLLGATGTWTVVIHHGGPMISQRGWTIMAPRYWASALIVTTCTVVAFVAVHPLKLRPATRARMLLIGGLSILAAATWLPPRPADFHGELAMHSATVLSFTCLLWGVGAACELARTTRLRLQAMAQRGYCRSCGYDLRGTIAAGRSECPECGAAFVETHENES